MSNTYTYGQEATQNQMQKTDYPSEKPHKCNCPADAPCRISGKCTCMKGLLEKLEGDKIEIGSERDSQFNRETGVSAAYLNEYAKLLFAYRNLGGITIIPEFVRQFPVQKYHQALPEARYVPTGQVNRASIARLDQLAEIANIELADATKATKEKLLGIALEVYELILGNNSEKIPSELRQAKLKGETA